MAAALAGAISIWAGATSNAGAQNATPDPSVQELERKLDQSLQRIEELSNRVQQLEGQRTAPAAGAVQAPTPAPAAPAASSAAPAQSPPAAATAPAAAHTATAPAPDSRIDALTSEVKELSQSVSRMNNDTGVPLHGFIDLGGRFYSRIDPDSSNNAHGFTEKAIDFYLTPALGPRMRALMEIAIETSEYNQSVGIDMERLQVGYVASDELTLWIGRFHTPYGYWNTAFHHGPQIQTSIQRPKFLAFEDTYGMMPAHTVGLWGSGRRVMGDGHVTYDLSVGNSPRIVTGGGPGGGGQVDMNLLGSNNHDLSTLLNVGYEFSGALDGMKLGLDAMRWRTTDDLQPPDTTNVRFVGAYGVYTENDWEVLSEYYRFNDTNVSAGGTNHRSWAAYAQVGHSFGKFTPYGRWEAALLDQTDNYFAILAGPIGSSYRRNTGGLRYDLTGNTALKFEANRTDYLDRGLNSYNEYRFQVAVRF